MKLITAALVSLFATVVFTLIGLNEYLCGFFSCTVYWVVATYDWRVK